MRKKWLPLVLFGLFPALTASGQSAQPPLNPNDWNFILIPSFEAGPAPDINLSTVGLNHALRFGQLLDTLLAGKQHQLRKVYALGLGGSNSVMKPLETIEPFAVLNNIGVKTVALLPDVRPSQYGSPAYFINRIVEGEPRGTYVMAMPRDMIRKMVIALTGTSVEVNGTHQYLVLSGRDNTFEVNTYCDHIADVTTFPRVRLPPRRAVCMQPSVTIPVKVPHGFHPYTSQTVYFVRHVEAHPNDSFENGNYVCRGQWRALGAGTVLLELMHGRVPNHVFTSAPTDIIDCSTSCSYARPSLTVVPLRSSTRFP